MFTTVDIFNIIGLIGIAITFIACRQADKENDRLHEINRLERERDLAEFGYVEDKLVAECAAECTAASPALRCAVADSSPKSKS